MKLPFDKTNTIIYNVFSFNNVLEIKMNDFLKILGFSNEHIQDMMKRAKSISSINPDATTYERAFAEMLQGLGVDLETARDMMHEKWNALVNNGAVSTSQVGNYLYVALPGVQKEAIAVEESTLEGYASIKITVSFGSHFVDVDENHPLVLTYPMPGRKIAGAKFQDGVLIVEVTTVSQTTNKINIG